MNSPSTALKAIPTTYAHVDFRSRLEARWAVFFDLLALPWEYEPERVRVDGVYYDPDFLVVGLPVISATGRQPARDFVMEVKPDKELSDEEKRKMRRYIANYTGGLVVLRDGPATVKANWYQARPSVTRVQFGRCVAGVGLYVLWTRQGKKVEKPWQGKPDAKRVFEACFTGQVGEARKAAARWKFDG